MHFARSRYAKPNFILDSTRLLADPYKNIGAQVGLYKQKLLTA